MVYEMYCRPKARPTSERMIQILAANGADQPFHKWMGQGKIGDGLDLCHLQYSQIGLPLVEPVKRIVVGAKVLRQPVLPSNGAVEHPAECHTIDGARMNAEPNDPARVLIHDHQDPMGPQRGRLAPE